MMKGKKFIVACILLVFFINKIFSREETYSPEWTMYTYEYNSMDEFYEYWIEAAHDFNCVEIVFYPDVNLSGRHGPSGFESRNGSTRWFYYQTLVPKMQTIYAEFYDSKNKSKSPPKFGKIFYLPEEYNQAIEYWNSIIRKM